MTSEGYSKLNLCRNVNIYIKPENIRDAWKLFDFIKTHQDQETMNLIYKLHFFKLLGHIYKFIFFLSASLRHVFNKRNIFLIPRVLSVSSL